MKTSTAERISLKSFLNAYFRENPFVEFKQHNDEWIAHYQLQPLDLELTVPVSYYSLTGRHQFAWPAQLVTHGQAQDLHPWCMIGLLMQDLSHRHAKAQSGHREFIQRFYNSCENLEIILKNLSPEKIEELFAEEIDFELTENGLLSGHQMHPVPKSREGFDKEEFKIYSPEFQSHFQLHYFVAHPSIVFTDSDLPYDANELVRKHFLKSPVSEEGIVIPLHPWQAKYCKQMPVIKKWLQKGLLKDLGLQGHLFTATSSIRTVCSKHSPFMAKLSLNVAITNSLRTQYAKELVRGVAAHKFWHSMIGQEVRQRFPHFSPITDPAYLCLRDGDNIIHETAALFRCNPFTETNNATSIATLCQDHPFAIKNRFNQLIPQVAANQGLSQEAAAELWFTQFLKVAVEPIFWMFVHHGVAIEAHQQNLLIDLKDGLPVASYYRDNQGYYIVHEAFKAISEKMEADFLQPLCHGTKEFIAHHLTYYLVCNSIFGVINAMGTAGVVSENKLMEILAQFIQQKHKEWPASNYLLEQLLQLDTLPFKGNLLTRFYDLDELIAPLEQQSVYVEIDNLIKKASNV